MIKIIIAVTFIMSTIGCGTISQYNQGCRDGVEGLKVGSTKEFREQYCNELDLQHSKQNEDQESHRLGRE